MSVPLLPPCWGTALGTAPDSGRHSRRVVAASLVTTRQSTGPERDQPHGHHAGVDYDMDSRATLLRRVDGIPHVVLGPLLLTVLAPLARLTGASRSTLAAILVPFTAYGVVVVAGTQELDASPPRWLVPLAVGANTAAVVVGLAAVARRDLTPPGRLAGGGLAAGGARLLLALRRPAP